VLITDAMYGLYQSNSSLILPFFGWYIYRNAIAKGPRYSCEVSPLKAHVDAEGDIVCMTLFSRLVRFVPHPIQLVRVS
jgi:hypothetical protein